MAARKRSTKKYEKGPFGDIYFDWKISEYPQPERSLGWYFGMIILAAFLVIYSIFTANFLFALIIILAVFIVLLKVFEKPRKINFQITDLGLVIGDQYIRYERVKNFWVIYEPPAVKKIFFSLKTLMPDISVDLDKINPVSVRSRLIKYLDEDLDKEYQTVDDQLETILKL